ncbi:MAG: UDP-glucose 4-epimerase GalE [Candidatus Hodarchaeota archaeon]
MRVLVTGGAGYIGSATVKSLIEHEHEVIVVDNLSKGKKELVDKKAEFYKVDLVDMDLLSKVFEKYDFDAVMHFAAYKSVAESMRNPKKYDHNVIGTQNLIKLMLKHNTPKIIFSSTAVVYKPKLEGEINENDALAPISKYGQTKQRCEELIKAAFKGTTINYIILRYFNVAGDCGLGYIDPEPENVFPIIMEVISGKRDKFVIFGDDYDTFDRTCIRDYIEINDLVRAHVMALKSNLNGIINLGTSKGVSVKELVETAIKVTGKKFQYQFGPRRKGDPPRLVASNKMAMKILGWQPKNNIREMIKTTFEAYKKI